MEDLSDLAQFYVQICPKNMTHTRTLIHTYCFLRCPSTKSGYYPAWTDNIWLSSEALAQTLWILGNLSGFLLGLSIKRGVITPSVIRASPESVPMSNSN